MATYQYGGIFIITQNDTLRVRIETAVNVQTNSHEAVNVRLSGKPLVPTKEIGFSSNTNRVTELDFSVDKILDSLKISYEPNDPTKATLLNNQNLKVSIFFKTGAVSLDLDVKLNNLIPIYQDNLTIDAFKYSNNFIYEPSDKTPYNYNLYVEVPDTGVKNFLYYGSNKDYIIYNSSNIILYNNSKLVTESLTQEEVKNFILSPDKTGLQNLNFVGSIGNINDAHPFVDDKIKDPGVGGTVVSVVFLNDAIQPDPVKPTIKVCNDPNAENYYLSSPYPKGCDINGVTFPDQASAQNAINTHNLQFINCCTYASVEDETFSITSGEVISVPSEADSDGGSIQWTWIGGTPPYDLTFTCAAGDTTCSNATVENTAAFTYAVTGLSGTADPAFSYGLTVEDSTGLTQFLPISGVGNVEAQATLNCKESSAVNYVNTGTTENGLCRWCDSHGRLVAAEDIDLPYAQNGLKAYDSLLGNQTTVTVSTQQLFNVQQLSFTQSVGLAPTGSWSLGVEFDDITNNSYSSQYIFDLGNSTVSPQLDGSGALIKVERKTLYNTLATESNFNDIYLDTYDGKGRWDVGFSEQTPTTTAYVDNGQTALSGGLFSNLNPGHYIYRVSYSDSNTAHNIELCHKYVTIQFRYEACTDPAASNYVGDESANSDLVISNDNLCSFPALDDENGTISDTIGELFDFNLVTINDDSMDACEFEASFSFTILQPAGPILPTIAAGFDSLAWTFSNFNLFFKHILAHISINYYGATSILPNLEIRNAVYTIDYYTLDVNNNSQSNTYSTTNNSVVNGVPSSYFINPSDPSAGYYDWTETFVFGNTPSALFESIGIQNASWTMDVFFNDSLIESLSINLMTDGPQVFSISDVIASGGASTFLDGISGGALCEDCVGLEDLLTPGCTDPAACNYNISATTDNGSCVGYQSPGADQAQITPGGLWYSEVLGEYGSPCGCIDPTYQEYSAVAFEYSEIYSPGIEQLPTGSAGTACITPHTSGCTDPSFTQYNPNATEDDGSCETYVVYGCIDPVACNYDENQGANTDYSPSICYYEVPSTDCTDFDNWSITVYEAPTTCSGSDTNTGTITISNSTWTGPVAFRVAGTGGDFTTVEAAIGTNTQLAGINDATGLSTVINAGDYISSQGADNGVQVLPFQSPTLGTSFTITNIGAGTYCFFIYPYLEDGVNASPDPCYCGISSITIADGIADAAYIQDSPIDENGGNFSENTFVLNASFGRSANRGTCGCCDSSSGTYDPTIDPANGGTCNQALCADYGCTDPDATNYNPNAALPCSDPTLQNGANGVPCKPCTYGYVDTLYTPAFCMPKKTSQQIDILRRCIGTAGTNAFMNTITGKSDCVTKDAWKLILIEYLMSKKGLDCIYNCADSSTPNLESVKTCKNKSDGKRDIIEHLSLNIVNTQIYYVGDTHKFSYSTAEANSNVERYYTLKYLPSLPDSDTISLSEIKVYNTNHVSYNGVSVEDLEYYKYAPTSWEGWKICEEPPNKPNNKNYIGKFINFVQNYCRQCQLPVTLEEAQATSGSESVITVNGIVITVNNSNIR
tara:strand:- start:3787 stop:8451 length:4665 start_codon:yes stop_codon:yes gene_type:complete